MSTVKKADLTACTDRYAALASTVTLPAGEAFTSVDMASTAGAVPTTVTLVSLQEGIRGMEKLFSGNCNCLTNTNCCQSCESTRCQSVRCQSCQSCESHACQITTCQSCQKEVCQSSTCQSSSQSCQSQACQSCQSLSCQSYFNCPTNCDCECNDGA